MKKIYKVKVIKSYLDTYWYADKIGEEFIVSKDELDYNYLVITEPGWVIDHHDAQIICEVIPKTVTIYEEVKQKIKKYRVVYKRIYHNEYEYDITSEYYSSIEEFTKAYSLPASEHEFISFIEDSMIEVEE